ncbi:hypothetical protein DYU11_21130 [Fibrisoma montanum]|uniref:Uncharacterized protein n=1 Tax=Fibrisoma montanum TaxID=2305895 RepID=A0A418M480_9BACT|nr:hypothetical protein [Fibrisoma montanum]RIV20551.1 hypothetical protein DYU11_21130 [Fibrisoma montanum]
MKKKTKEPTKRQPPGSEERAVKANFTVSRESESIDDEYQQRYRQLVTKVLELTLDSGFDAFILTVQEAQEPHRLSTAIGTNDPITAISMMNSTTNVMAQFMRHTGALPDINLTAPGGIS